MCVDGGRGLCGCVRLEQMTLAILQERVYVFLCRVALVTVCQQSPPPSLDFVAGEFTMSRLLLRLQAGQCSERQCAAELQLVAPSLRLVTFL